MITLSDRLKELRKSNNLTQEELGKILGVGKTTISMYENGNSTPNDEIKMIIADYFNVTLDYLLGKSDIKNYDKVKKEPTIALHSDHEYDELPDEAKKEIENFIEFIKAKYKK
ncbi:MAG: helix-turn-helix transcriptional regulator [Clostridium sp.]|uniref:helix-turn-helix transcriptional regulator n=1 Tax=Clostridium sp. TaxID=1506 RepID=UPI001EBE3B36|nr:helix-turn-helix transcriptional regulator [Clostridium sp.]MBS5886271.1 helix-turn-helix transcriptional regulator [Clostridium sp.]MDU7148301.1 helix-turn-helix transcriptional regulator [Clostridium sp.]